MRRYISIASLLLFSFSVAFGFLPGTSASSDAHIIGQEHLESSAELISELDDCIQQRFLDVDQAFGFRRLTRVGETPHRFKPENAKELSVVRYLTGANLNVVLYLAGRNIVQQGTDTREINRSVMKGPIFITDNDKRVTGSPTPLELLEHGQKAMRVFQKSDAYDFAIRDWRIIARPVRASSSSCLKCHHSSEINIFSQTEPEQESNRLKIGDALGVLLYAYKNGR